MSETRTTGGVKTLGLKADSDAREASEPLNIRQPDELDSFLRNYLHAEPTGFFTDKQFQISDATVTARPEYLVFDRHYPALNLLVDFRPTAYKYEVQREETLAEVQRKKEFAQSRGFRYLPIFDGRVTAEELQEAGLSSEN